MSDSTLQVSADMLHRLNYLANIRRKDVSEVLAEAVGLEEEFVQARSSGGRMLIAKNGSFEELIPPQDPPRPGRGRM